MIYLETFSESGFMKTKIKLRLAGGVAILVGLLSLVSGSAVLLDIKQPAYHVLPLLVIYNVVMGVVSLAAGIGIWRNCGRAARLAFFVASAHTAVLLILLFFNVTNRPVASESIAAMIFRTLVWLGISFTVWKAQKAE